MQQETHIKNLKQKIKKHALEKGCQDLQLEENDSEEEEIEDFRAIVSQENFRKKDL